jgi:serine/threonine protein kinase
LALHRVRYDQGRLIETGQLAAIKVVNLKEDELEEILTEVAILKDSNHENIVKYFGCFVLKGDLWVSGWRYLPFSGGDH